MYHVKSLQVCDKRCVCMNDRITDDNNSMMSRSSRKKNKEKRVARKAEDESSSSLNKKGRYDIFSSHFIAVLSNTHI